MKLRGFDKKQNNDTVASISVIGLEGRTKCEIWTRVMGYHRPVSAWNKGKQAEHKERRYFQERHDC
ncbi:hypothetical protein TI03_06725 [Achromatium sp. WMS1]|nr:hypothetical protein TI03_06725 [Achromatium sp. WMS1]